MRARGANKQTSRPRYTHVVTPGAVTAKQCAMRRTITDNGKERQRDEKHEEMQQGDTGRDNKITIGVVRHDRRQSDKIRATSPTRKPEPAKVQNQRVEGAARVCDTKTNGSSFGSCQDRHMARVG